MNDLGTILAAIIHYSHVRDRFFEHPVVQGCLAERRRRITSQKNVRIPPPECGFAAAASSWAAEDQDVQADLRDHDCDDGEDAEAALSRAGPWGASAGAEPSTVSAGPVDEARADARRCGDIGKMVFAEPRRVLPQIGVGSDPFTTWRERPAVAVIWHDLCKADGVAGARLATCPVEEPLMKSFPVLIAALVLGSLAAPAFAKAGDDGDRLPVTYDAKHDKYCVSQEVTGQLIPLRACKTKAEWAKLGAVVGDKPATKVAQGKETAATN